MSKAIISEQMSPEMRDGRQTNAERTGDATAHAMTEGFAKGADISLKTEPDDFISPNGSRKETQSRPEPSSAREDTAELLQPQILNERLHLKGKRVVSEARGTKLRSGLPPDFIRRLGRYGRSVLLEDNVYRLANGQEFIPQHPTGTLGCRHAYALLTIEQYVGGKRGSVYVRTDGRIFDYGFDNRNPAAEMFDTGYTIYDLERTGRYAPDVVGSRHQGGSLIRKLTSGKYRLYSKKKDPKSGKRRNLGTFNTRKAAEKHERTVQYFKSR